MKFIEWFYNRYRPHGHNEGAPPPAEAMSAKLNSVAEIAFSVTTKFLQPPKSQLGIYL